MNWNPNWQSAIASIESAGSGNYGAVGPLTKKGNRAYGRYQVMDFNIPSWTKKYLGKELTPEQFLNSPEAQDAVFKGEFGSYVDKYGNPQDAASMWFTGRPASQGAGRSDVLGTTGADYVSKFNKALGDSGAISAGIASDTMTALGKQPKGILAPQATDDTESKPMTPTDQPRGLLGSLGIQKMEEGAAGETGQRFYERESFKDTAATLAQGFAALGSNPAIQKMASDVAAQRSEGKARNKTVEYLRKNGREDLADMVEKGLIGGREAAAALMQKPKDDRTALMKNYEFAKQTGYKGSFNDFLRSGGAGGSVVNVGGNQVQRVGDFAVIPDETSEAGVRFVPIPGSKAAQEAQAGEQRKEAAAGQAEQKETVVSGSIDYLLDKIESGGRFDLPESGVVGSFLGRLGVNQEAVDFRNELATVQANIAFDRLQQMREASKTGGALGAVSERELDLLMNAYGNINQSTGPERLAENLKTIKDIMTQIENDPVASSFYYGNSTGTGSVTQPQSGSVTVGEPY